MITIQKSIFLASVLAVGLAANAWADPNTPSAQVHHHQMMAKQALLNHDLKAASTEILQGAEILKAEAVKATGETQKGLQDSGAAIEKLAKQVETGAMTAPAKVDIDFARAYKYLSAKRAKSEK